MKKLSILILMFMVVLTACDEQTTTPPNTDPKGVFVVIEHLFENQPINFGSVEYATTNNIIGVSNLTYYLSGFGLQRQDGSWYDIPAYHMVVAQDKPIDTINLGLVPEGRYTAMRFYIGVDSINNHGDPAAWPNTHPLSLMRGGQMHWSWNSGYIFLKMEGRYRKPATENGFYSYHIGRDDLITPITISGLNVNGGENRSVTSLVFDAATFFNTPHVHMISDTSGFTHSSYGDPIADVLHGNMFGLFKKKP